MHYDEWAQPMRETAVNHYEKWVATQLARGYVLTVTHVNDPSPGSRPRWQKEEHMQYLYDALRWLLVHDLEAELHAWEDWQTRHAIDTVYIDFEGEVTEP